MLASDSAVIDDGCSRRSLPLTFEASESRTESRHEQVDPPCVGCLGLGRRLPSAIDFNWRSELPASEA